MKASANKIKIWMNYCGPIFSGVYHPQDTRGEKEECRNRTTGSVRNPLNLWEFRGHSMENPWEICGPVTDY